MKRMAAATALPGKKTNHSVRKTMCTNLLHAGVALTNIIQLSGHKNVASLSNYATASRSQQQAMCDILKNPSTSDSSTQPTHQREPLQPLAVNQPVNSTNALAVPPRNVLAATTHHTTMTTAINTPLDHHTLFSGAIIHGGVFNVTVNNYTDTDHHHQPPKRRRVVYSDSDTD